MRKPTVTPALLAWTLVAAAIAGCIAQPPQLDGPTASHASADAGRSLPPTPGPTDVDEASVDPGPTITAVPPTAVPVTAAACELRKQPGLADAAPTEGDLMDWSHTFGGRARLCLDGAQPAEFEGTAWCTWSRTFDAVDEASLLQRPVNADNGSIDAGVSLDIGKAYVSGTSPGGDISSWEGLLRRQDVRIDDQGRRGIARFNVEPVLDPEHPPAVAPPNLVGLLRWACLEPPAR